MRGGRDVKMMSEGGREKERRQRGGKVIKKKEGEGKEEDGEALVFLDSLHTSRRYER